MLDLETRLLSAAVASDAWRSLFLEAYDHIVWLGKERTMWRKRATGADNEAYNPEAHE